MILRTEGVSKIFGSLRALHNVDLEIVKGEVFGIAGPNGAGKSTFFNVVAGAFPPTKGRILFDGHDITTLKSHQTCNLGLARTFQVPQTFPTLTVYDNIRVGITFGTTRKTGLKNRIEKTLDFLDLNDVRDVMASNLDLYTTKLVMMAACLATECKLLMLDEPLAGLSISEISDFLKVIRHVNEDGGTTILMIEHILDSLIDISNRMLILDNGEVIYTGDPEGVRTDPRVVEVYLGDGEVILEEDDL
ncbi:MAG: ABC transporter ATP-binding protein [Deltaproteobacteria bacterium]|nr:ABC transporter ATP-binding protein [Desulfobacula sp.]MBT5546215.1 ABC transporter ATP-binding protein [Desulfobacula sp.]MBT6615535.1 ABC transporter ATP-binding protein [Deltaproteobacteria bacterium]MBT7713046.1 ABC transporter ATP-binding protein [Deltaproteobacteria bacterium]MBT7889589.1 ABC transporter ATP-binding protein [Deltaproteobacteria bacterium]